MKAITNVKASAIAAVALVAQLHGPALAGGLFGEGGLIRGDVGNALDTVVEKPVTTPIARGAERTVKEIGQTLQDTGKGALAASGLKSLEDTLIEGKSLKSSLKESLSDIKVGVQSAADTYSIPNHTLNSYTEATRNALGPDAGRALGLVLLPEQVVRSLPGATTAALISASERADNVENIVGIPLASAITQAKQYYEGKGSPIPEGISRLLQLTFDENHLKGVRYIVDAHGGNIAGLINGLRDIIGDTKDGNHAVAIDNIIVFTKEPGGVEDLFFWAHEVQHTVQYSALGIEKFAAKYTQDHASLENEADVVAERAVENVRLVVSALSGS